MLEPRPLTTRQHDILTVIVRYNRAIGEACPVSYLARRFDVHHSSMQKCVTNLYRKGWLYGPNSPAKARHWLGNRRSRPAKVAGPQV